MGNWWIASSFVAGLGFAMTAQAEWPADTGAGAGSKSLADPIHAREAAAMGEAFIADSPTGPLGLRFSGGVIVDSQAEYRGDRDHTTNLTEIREGSPYLGIGVAHSLGENQQLDLSADIGLIQRINDVEDDCLDQTCQSPRDNEAILSIGIRYRF